MVNPSYNKSPLRPSQLLRLVPAHNIVAGGESPQSEVTRAGGGNGAVVVVGSCASRSSSTVEVGSGPTRSGPAVEVDPGTTRSSPTVKVGAGGGWRGGALVNVSTGEVPGCGGGEGGLLCCFEGRNRGPDWVVSVPHAVVVVRGRRRSRDGRGDGDDRDG